MTIICSGSLAIDRLYSFPGSFADNIIADKIEMMNVCFVVDTSSAAFGGTAGNIVYNLGLLGEKPCTVACLGDDGDGKNYLNWLAEQNLPLDSIKVLPGRSTAGCTITTDKKSNQITCFHPGAMMTPSGFDPAMLPQPYNQHLAIVSPGGPDEMKNLCKAYRELGFRFILDPGQQITMFSGKELIDMLEGSSMLICNEYEFELLREYSGLNIEGLFSYTEAVIVTKGPGGSDLIVPGRGSQHIDALPVAKVANPTGAGDAYRAGLLKALAKERPEHLISACRLGATVAAFCVENEGGPQTHSFTPAKVASRHASFFKEQIQL